MCLYDAWLESSATRQTGHRGSFLSHCVGYQYYRKDRLHLRLSLLKLEIVLVCSALLGDYTLIGIAKSVDLDLPNRQRGALPICNGHNAPSASSWIAVELKLYHDNIYLMPIHYEHEKSEVRGDEHVALALDPLSRVRHWSTQ